MPQMAQLGRGPAVPALSAASLLEGGFDEMNWERSYRQGAEARGRKRSTGCPSSAHRLISSSGCPAAGGWSSLSVVPPAPESSGGVSATSASLMTTASAAPTPHCVAPAPWRVAAHWSFAAKLRRLRSQPTARQAGALTPLPAHAPCAATPPPPPPSPPRSSEEMSRAATEKGKSERGE